MKDFREFLQFMGQDCDLDLLNMSASVVKTYAHRLVNTGLSEESVAALIEMSSYAAMQVNVTLLHRYHEWLHEPPEAND